MWRKVNDKEIEIPDFAGGRAFTIVELLIVIAILAVFAGLLLPAVGKARAKVESVVCLNHLRQLQVAFHVYADDNLEFLSPAQTDISRDGQPRWVDGIMSPYATDRHSDMTNRQLLVAPGPGHLGPYVQKSDIFHCPSDRSRTNILDFYKPKGPLRVRSYTMNVNMVFGEGVSYDDERIVYSPTAFVKWSDFNRTSPAATWVFIDEHELTIKDGNFQSEWRMGPRWKWSGHWPARRHNDRVALSFADGHGELHRWGDSRTGPRVRNWAAAFEVGFDAYDNQDYRWLWERTNGGIPTLPLAPE